MDERPLLGADNFFVLIDVEDGRAAQLARSVNNAQRYGGQTVGKPSGPDAGRRRGGLQRSRSHDHSETQPIVLHDLPLAIACSAPLYPAVRPGPWFRPRMKAQ